MTLIRAFSTSFSLYSLLILPNWSYSQGESDSNDGDMSLGACAALSVTLEDYIDDNNTATFPEGEYNNQTRERPIRFDSVISQFFSHTTPYQQLTNTNEFLDRLIKHLSKKLNTKDKYNHLNAMTNDLIRLTNHYYNSSSESRPAYLYAIQWIYAEVITHLELISEAIRNQHAEIHSNLVESMNKLKQKLSPLFKKRQIPEQAHIIRGIAFLTTSSLNGSYLVRTFNPSTPPNDDIENLFKRICKNMKNLDKGQTE